MAPAVLQAAERMTDARRSHEQIGHKIAALQLELANSATALHLAVADFQRALTSPLLPSGSGSLSSKARAVIARSLSENPAGLTIAGIIAFAKENGWPEGGSALAALYTAISRLEAKRRITSQGDGRSRLFFAKATT